MTKVVNGSRLFGFLIVASFFNFNFIARDWLFLKTAVGRGVFDLFVAGTFVPGVAAKNLGSIIMALALAACGIGFILAGWICGKDADMKDLSKEDTAKAAAKTGAKGAVAAGKMAADPENQKLLADA